MTFWGEYRGRGHPHESPAAMTAPLVILAVLAVGAGALGLPEVFHTGEPTLPHFVAPVVAAAERTISADAHHQIEWFGLIVGVVAAALGIGVGAAIWRAPDNPWELPTPGGLLEKTRAVLANAWYYDDVVNKRGAQPAVKYFSHVLWRWIDDETVDRGLVDGAGRVGKELSLFARAFQSGQVARYAGYVTLGAVLIPLVALVIVPGWHDLMTYLTSGAAGH
jgi:NADH-quinone oxidoreductase subunit L